MIHYQIQMLNPKILQIRVEIEKQEMAQRRSGERRSRNIHKYSLVELERLRMSGGICVDLADWKDQEQSGQKSWNNYSSITVQNRAELGRAQQRRLCIADVCIPETVSEPRIPLPTWRSRVSMRA